MRNDKKERCALTSVIENELELLKDYIHVLKTLKESQPYNNSTLQNYKILLNCVHKY